MEYKVVNQVVLVPPRQLVKVRFNPKTESEKAIFVDDEKLNDFLTLNMSALELRKIDGYTIEFVRHSI